MRHLLLSAVFAALALPAAADVEMVITRHILPAQEKFAAATADLAKAAAADCTPAGLRAPFNAAWDAYLGVQHLQFGPLFDQGRYLAIAYWPDPKGLGGKAQAALLRAADPAVLEPETFAQQSVALRGLTGLERLLYADPAVTGDYPCALIRATADDLASMAGQINQEWRSGFADKLRHPGQPASPYLTEVEVKQELFTQLVAALEFDADTRLGRPLGTFDRPRPTWAEAQLSNRALRNLRLSLMALQDFTHALAGDTTPQTRAAFDRAIKLADALQDPELAGVADPQGRLKVEILQQAVQAARDGAKIEVGAALGVEVGFNSGDGD